MPQPLVCPPSFSPGRLLIILFQLTKSEATSCKSFGDIFVGRFRCPNLQRALPKKNLRLLAVKVLEISLLEDFDVQICKGLYLKNAKGDDKKCKGR